MRRTAWIAAALLATASGLASAKDDKGDKTKAAKPAQVLRCAHSYAEAMAEAKDRGCVVFATMHEDG
jgi:hypothetical protein